MKNKLPMNWLAGFFRHQQYFPYHLQLPPMHVDLVLRVSYFYFRFGPDKLAICSYTTFCLTCFDAGRFLPFSNELRTIVNVKIFLFQETWQ